MITIIVPEWFVWLSVALFSISAILSLIQIVVHRTHISILKANKKVDKELKALLEKAENK